MEGIVFGIFAISFILFFGTFHYLLATKRPGVYPPKPLLKKRAFVLGIGGIFFFIIGLFLFYVTA